MNAIVVTGVDELEQHLDELIQDPTLLPREKLFDQVQIQLTESNIQFFTGRLLPKVTTILRQYTLDPAPIASLTTKLLLPLTFEQMLSLASEESLVQALDSPAPSANMLALTAMHKAAASPGDAAIISLSTPLLAAFLRCWLLAPEEAVGEKGAKVLGDLLDVDCDLSPDASSTRDVVRTSGRNAVRISTCPGLGRLWRRLFVDGDLYTLLLDICAGRHAKTRGDAKRCSVAQARLTRVMSRLAVLNLEAVTRSDVVPPTPSYTINGHGASTPRASAPRQGDGLLHFVVLRMVDKRDLLMHLVLLDSIETLVLDMCTIERSAYMTETMRALLGEAVADDEKIREALATLPDRTEPELAGSVRTWLREMVPGPVRQVTTGL